MIKIRTFSNVPADKLKQFVDVLELEVRKDTIRVTPQPDNKWQVDVALEQPPASSGTTPLSSSGNFTPFKMP